MASPTFAGMFFSSMRWMVLLFSCSILFRPVVFSYCTGICLRNGFACWFSGWRLIFVFVSCQCRELSS